MDEDDILCSACGKHPARWLITDIVEGEPHQQNLCDSCYREKEGSGPRPEDAFARLLAAIVPELQELEARECPACGIDYLEFRQSMKLGCPRDYEVFDRALEPLLERIHGSARHCGKSPPGLGPEAAIRGRLRSLRRQQKRAIAEENYELAAELRDRMRKLEQHGSDATEGQAG
jgi:protein arginine kinase activator